MANCFYCEDGETRKSLMIEICKLKMSTVYLNKDQKHKGRVVLKFKDHKTEVCDLTPEENQIFFSELSKVVKAIVNLYHPDKVNYGIYGDLVPHLHIHIVPNIRKQTIEIFANSIIRDSFFFRNSVFFKYFRTQISPYLCALVI